MVFFFKQKTAYEMRISDWSSDVCSSDLVGTLGILEASDIGAKAVEQGHEVADLGRGDGIFQFDVRHDPFSLDVAAPSLGRYGHKEKRPGRLMPPGRLGDRKSTRLNSSH